MYRCFALVLDPDLGGSMGDSNVVIVVRLELTSSCKLEIDDCAATDELDSRDGLRAPFLMFGIDDARLNTDCNNKNLSATDVD